jgi:hypothetical protein
MVKKTKSAPSNAQGFPVRNSSGRRERRTVETRESLFRAALDLFARKGFTETTVEDITEAADVGKGTFFNYFPSKDHILLAPVSALAWCSHDAGTDSAPGHHPDSSSGISFNDSRACGNA